MAKQDGRERFEKLPEGAKEGIVTFVDATEAWSAEEVEAIQEYVLMNLPKLKKKYL